MAGGLQLRFRVGREAERSLVPDGDEIRIGRDLGCTIVVDHDGVDPVHCVLVRAGSQWRVKDNDSRHGTFVVRSGELPKLCLPELDLRDGDKVMIGHESEPRFLAWLAAAEAPARPPPSAAPDASAELESVRRELGLALQERDRLRADLERIRSQHSSELNRQRHDYERELAGSQAKITVQETTILDLRDKVSTLTLARDDWRQRAERNVAERDRALAIAQQAQADANESTILAQDRAIVIERQEGQLRYVEASVGERDAQLANREREIVRLREELAAARGKT
jgi:hypothetical protein